MTNKDEALKMAHTTFMQINERFPRRDNGNGYFDKEIIACKEALEQPTVAKLNDEYLRDTNVIGLEQPAWQGLNTEDVMRLWREFPFDRGVTIGNKTFLDIARAIEQASRNKNGY